MKNGNPKFDSHLAVETLDGLDDTEALKHVALLIDGSLDFNRLDGLEKAIRLGDQLVQRQLKPNDAARLNYFLSNAWANRQHLAHAGTPEVWRWELPEAEKQIIHLRRAFRSEGFQGLHQIERCQILTNLANLMNTVGRFVEALGYWSQALAVSSTFGMALGNRGVGLVFYSRELYDDGHRPIFLRFAHVDLVAALATDPADPGAIDPWARKAFKEQRSWIESVLPKKVLKQGSGLKQFPFGSSKNEVRYRKWCLEGRLFLNPLNDLGPYSIAARDVLMTPSMLDDGKSGPAFLGLYNQMKQEYISARYLMFEGLTSRKPHFSDNDVLLSNTLDYPSHCLAVEKVKAAFRIAYSVLDKIAYFLNHYLGLGVSDQRVTMRTIWYEKQERKNGLRKEFERRENWPLRGLFWLSKDLFEKSADFKECLEPDAQELDVIRNHAEHKYLKIHEMLVRRDAAAGGTGDYDLFRDALAFSIERSDFEAKALRILSMVRAALIYLSLAVHVEERRKRKEAPQGSFISPIHVGTIDDGWKS